MRTDIVSNVSETVLNRELNLYLRHPDTKIGLAVLNQEYDNPIYPKFDHIKHDIKALEKLDEEWDIKIERYKFKSVTK